MRRFIVSLLSSILAFTAGLVTASSWSSNDNGRSRPVTIEVQEPCAPTPPQPPTPVKSYTTNPPHEFDFGQKGLRLVPERVQLKSERNGYDVDVSYPQILGARYMVSDPINVRKINQHLKDAATNLYQWPLRSSETELRAHEARSGIRDTVNFTYEVGLATDALLSINFIGYSYNGHSNSQVQESFTLNYDLIAGKNLKLSDIFKPGSNYLEFISHYCIIELSKNTTARVHNYALEPTPQNFQSWQITSNGITFHFYACKVVDCAEGDQTVRISWDDMKALLNPGIPGKFEIAYQ